MSLHFGKNYAADIADLSQKVAEHCGTERGVICAVDCLRQWDAGGKKLLKRTLEVWDLWLYAPDACQTDENRHGAWVPAIPLE